MEAILRRAQDKPNLVAHMLLQKGTDLATTADDIRQLIGSKNMVKVERAVWERMFKGVLQRNENIFVTGKLEDAFNAIGEPAQRALWGKNLPKIRRFVSLVDNANLSPTLKNPNPPTSLLGFGQFAKVPLLASSALFVLRGTKDAGDFAVNLACLIHES
jgi:hypothetical protein